MLACAEPDPPRTWTMTAGINWQEALAPHQRWLRTVLFARLADRDAVEEVVQEVSLAAIAQRAPLNDANKLGAWLYRVALRQVLLYRRKRGRARRLVNGFAERNILSETDCTPDPLEWLLMEERRELVRIAMGRLPSRDAEILLLKYTEAWSYHELSARLGISQSAVESRLHRARAKLRTELATVQLIETET